MISSVLLLLAQAAPASSTKPNEIIVVGRRAEQDLVQCLARDCPPAEEIEMSLQASVEQFTSGRYDDARSTLRNAIRRNRDHAADLPGPVSSLYATLSTVAEHTGDTAVWLRSARTNVEVLRRYVGESNVATLGQELSFGDTMVGIGTTREASAVYRNVQRKAEKAGHSDMAAGAAFRRAWLALTLGRYSDAEHLADEAVALARSNVQLMVELREIVRTRIAISHGDKGAVDALAKRLRQSAAEMPTLIFAPPIDDINRPTAFAQSNIIYDSAIAYADLGFWIRPDGRTSGIEVLRNAGLGPWRPGILRQIKARRYVPFDANSGYPGTYRIERFTVRADYGVPVGSRMKQRIGKLTVHVVDLTQTDAMSAAQRERMQEASAHR